LKFNEYNGDYPQGEDLKWKDNAILRTRLLKTLNKYKKPTKVIVVCHGMLIHSVFKDHWLENSEIIEFSF
jgi:hypothetical protein